MLILKSLQQTDSAKLQANHLSARQYQLANATNANNAIKTDEALPSNQLVAPSYTLKDEFYGRC